MHGSADCRTFASSLIPGCKEPLPASTAYHRAKKAPGATSLTLRFEKPFAAAVFALYYQAVLSSCRACRSHAQKQRGPPVNLPPQMRAVSRAAFPKSRFVGPAGQVHPSWLFICNPPSTACSCSDNSVTCCDQSEECSCGAGGTGPAACVARGQHGNGHPHHHAKGNCAQGPLNCYDSAAGPAVPCN
jgi:hypothetical protein